MTEAGKYRRPVRWLLDLQPVSQRRGNTTYLLAFKLGGQSPVERASQPTGVEVPGVQQHVAALLVNPRHHALQVQLTNH